MKSVQSSEFLEAWKRKSDECADYIFLSLWIDGPSVSGELKQAAIDEVMRLVWHRIDAPNKADAVWENLNDIKKYTAELVDKVVAERWERVTAASR